MTQSKLRQTTVKRRIAIAALPRYLFALLFFLLAGAGQSAQAQISPTGAPAGSSIGNQATATYTDSANVTRTSTSNVVTTTVQQVAFIDLIDDRTQSAGPSSPVYFSHTVTNNGNGADTFSLTAVDTAGDNFNITPKIYADANSDGSPDNNVEITTSGPLNPGSSFNFVVSGAVTALAVSGNTSVITVTATSAFSGAVTDSNTDTVNVTNNAAVSVVKAIDDSSGPSPSGPYTYTLTYTNSGGSAATNLTITDLIPAGMTYVEDSGTWSLSGTALTDTNGAADDTAGIDYSFDTTGNGTVSANILSVPAGTSGHITFQVNVNSGLSPRVIANQADFAYNDGTTDRDGTTNTNNFTVTRTVDLTFDGPAVATPSAPQGGVVDFSNTLVNNGSGDDSFDIVVNSPGSFPVGTTFQLLKTGGSALLDTNGNGVPDTGPVASGASFIVILRVQLPTEATGGGSYVVTKTATSFADPTEEKTATDTLTTITPSTVDLTNTPNPGGDGAGAGPEVNPVQSQSTNPGTTVTFELDVQNKSGIPDTYALQYSQTASFASAVPLPAGWSVTFRDATNTVVSNTGVLASNATRTLFADITVPADFAPGIVAVYFRAISPTTGANDIIHDEVAVNTIRSLSVEPNNTGQIFANNSVVYSHTIANTGNVVETNIAVTSANTTAGFTSVVYPDTDNDGVLDPAEIATPLTNIPSLGIGASIPVFVKVFAPAGATLGTSNVTTLTGSVTAGPSDTATDNTTVITGDIRLVKEQAIDPDGDGALPLGAYSTAIQVAKPGAIIRYRMTVSNTGAGPVTLVTINDTTPPLTVYDNGTGANTAVGNAVWTRDNITFTAASPVPGDGSSGTLVFTIGTLTPGQSAIATFGVKIRN